MNYQFKSDMKYLDIFIEDKEYQPFNDRNYDITIYGGNEKGVDIQKWYYAFNYHDENGKTLKHFLNILIDQLWSFDMNIRLHIDFQDIGKRTITLLNELNVEEDI